jgi:hypothetical protein
VSTDVFEVIGAIAGVLSLLIGVPQGVVALKAMKSAAPTDPVRAHRRRRMLFVAGGLLILGVGLLVGSWMGGDSEKRATETSTPLPATTTAPTSSTPPSSSSPSSTSPTTTSAPAGTPFEVSVSPPGCGASSGVDVHLDDPIRVEPGEKESKQADLEYDDCEGNLYPGSNGAVGIFTGGPSPARGDCEAAARRNPIGETRSIHTLKTGTVLCFVTDEGNVAVATITALGAPFKSGGDGSPQQPTITLAGTRW